MTFQPKSYRKLAVASATAAVAVSAAAPAASAAEETAAEAFTDVKVDQANYEALNALYQAGDINGYANGKFGTWDPIKRIDAGLIMYNVFDKLEEVDADQNPWTDIPDRGEDVAQDDASLAQVAASLYVSGTFHGYANNTLGAQENLTRGQMAKIIADVLELNTTEAPQAPFSDLDETSFDPYINAVYEVGLINGKGDGTFAPNENVTRKDFAAVVQRAWEYAQVDTVESLGATVTEPIPGKFSVLLSGDNIQVAEGEKVYVVVDGEKVELEYQEAQNAYFANQISAESKEEVNSFEVVVEETAPTPPISNAITLEEIGTEEVNVKSTLPGLYTVAVFTEDVEGLTSDSTATLTFDGQTYEGTYQSSAEAFVFIDVRSADEASVYQAELSF